MAGSLQANEGHLDARSHDDANNSKGTEESSDGINLQNLVANIFSECDTKAGDLKCGFCHRVGISKLQNELQGIGYPRKKMVTKQPKQNIW